MREAALHISTRMRLPHTLKVHHPLTSQLFPRGQLGLNASKGMPLVCVDHAPACVQQTPMPQEYADMRVSILCNDCQVGRPVHHRGAHASRAAAATTAL